MFLQENELVIRDSTKKDASILCKWWNDGKVMEHAGYPNGLNTTVDKIVKQIESNTINHKRLILECDKYLIGEMSYKKVEEGVVEIGIKICEAFYQGKGYGTRYLSMLINYLFNDLKFTKIVLDTNLDNLRAQHVYEKLGFIKLRINYDSWLDQLNRPQSSVDYELVKDNHNN